MEKKNIKKTKGFLSHEAISVTNKGQLKLPSFINMLLRNAGSVLLTGCSPAEPVSSSTS